MTIAVHLCLWSFPAASLDGLAILLVAVHQAGRRFVLGAATQLAGAAAGLFVLLAAVPRWGIDGVLVAQYVSGGLQICVLVGSLLTEQSGHEEQRWRHALPKIIGAVAWGSLPALLFHVLAGSTMVVDRMLAAPLREGGVALIYWAQKIYNLPLALLTLPMLTAMYPDWASASARRGQGVEEGIHVESLVGSLHTIVPCSLVLVVFADTISRVAFLRGSFSEGDVVRLSSLLRWYGVGVGVLALYTAAYRALFALGRGWASAAGATVQALSYPVLGVLATRRWGLDGLAISYVVSVSAGAVVMRGFLGRQATTVNASRRRAIHLILGGVPALMGGIVFRHVFAAAARSTGVIVATFYLIVGFIWIAAIYFATIHMSDRAAGARITAERV